MTSPKLVNEDETSIFSDIEEHADNYLVFAQFKPLVGGPSFLPLHVEVIIAPSSSESGMNLLENSVAHRFDFLPLNPENPAVLQQLISFQSVPGLVRYRTINTLESNITSFAADSEIKNNKRQKQINLSIPLGFCQCFPIKSADLIKNLSPIDKAVNFSNDFQRERGELNILFNNCITFAISLLLHLELTIQLDLSGLVLEYG